MYRKSKACGDLQYSTYMQHVQYLLDMICTNFSRLGIHPELEIRKVPRPGEVPRTAFMLFRSSRILSFPYIGRFIVNYCICVWCSPTLTPFHFYQTNMLKSTSGFLVGQDVFSTLHIALVSVTATLLVLILTMREILKPPHKRRQRNGVKWKMPPGPRGWPFFGSLHDVQKRSYETVRAQGLLHPPLSPK